jgi:AraC-like DNA-binding protein
MQGVDVMPYRRAYRRHARPFERLGVRVQGLSEVDQHAGLQRFLKSSNFAIEALGDEIPLVANVARFPRLTFAHVVLPEVRIGWPRDAGSAHRALLLISATGTLTVETEGGVLRRGPGVALVRPGEDRVSISTRDPHNELIYVGFGAEILAEAVLPAVGVLEAPPLDWQVIAPFYAFVAALCASGGPVSESPATLAGASRALVKELVGVLTRDVSVPGSLIDAARVVIEAEFADPGVTVARIAQRLGVAPRTLQAVFAAEGTTVSAELRRARLSAARSAKAANPRMTARDVAKASGFGSVSAMSRALRGDEAPELAP